jgi:hypothetical protein
MRLQLLADRFAVCRCAASEPYPAWARGGSFLSLTRTSEELSIVCREDLVPQQVRQEIGWRCLQVEGPLEFSQTGVLAGLATPLADREIPVFVVSTYDTDYLLVPEVRLDDALATLQAAGHLVEERPRAVDGD